MGVATQQSRTCVRTGLAYVRFVRWGGCRLGTCSHKRKITLGGESITFGSVLKYMKYGRTGSTLVSSGCTDLGCKGKISSVDTDVSLAARLSLSRRAAFSLAFFCKDGQTGEHPAVNLSLVLHLLGASCLPENTFSPYPSPATALLGQGCALRPLAPLLLGYQD